ncbi:MAG: acyl-CoA/acyl-ACP dehydrogenase [Deltaproteobacteria bacterium]|nr:acyl-CoA/acyl-ACP dehydrogenase [Deltaproteobacteria bacterium]
MNFDFSDDQKLLRKTAREFLSEHAPLTLCRAVLESDASYSDTLWKSTAELGWQGTSIPEEHGGAGFGHLEMAALAEEIGYALTPIPFSSSVYLATEALLLAGTEKQKQAYLPRLASGELIGTFAQAEQAGESATPATTLSQKALTGNKLPVPDGDVAHFAVVSAKSGKNVGLALVDLAANGVARRKIRSIDPSRSLAAIDFDGAAAQWLGDAPCGAETIRQLIDRAAVLYAFEQLGGATRAFEITREFTLGRYAFGRPVASFQAIKHRLADLYVEIELARSNSYYGAWALANNAPELGVSACGARVSASDAFELAGKEIVQLHGGVGFTWEYDCHLFYRRAKWMSAILGNPNIWRDRLIERLQAGNDVGRRA